MWIDSHCHLNHKNFDGAQPDALIAQAKGQGVDGMVSICCRISEELPQLLSIADSITSTIMPRVTYRKKASASIFVPASKRACR
jgi:TatD DNase family protein